MNKWRAGAGVFGVLIVASAGIALYLFQGHEVDQPESDTLAAPGFAGKFAASADAPDREAGSIREVQLTWKEVLSMDQRRVALSMEEAEWMRRHGYVTNSEMQALSHLETAPLRGTRDMHLATMHGLALKEKGDLLPAVSVLEGAAAMGSVYGYEEAAIAAYRLANERFGASIENDDLLRARLEVARILGDYKVDYLITEYLPNYPMHERAGMVQSYATTFLGKLGEEAQLMGLPAPGPDPRPNIEAWRQLQEQGADGQTMQVKVYVLN